jgi:hypothetical protein
MSCCFGGKLLYVGNLGTLAGSLLSLFSPGTRSVAVKEARGKEEVQKAFAPRDDGETVFEMGRAHQLRGGAVTCRETVAVYIMATFGFGMEIRWQSTCNFGSIANAIEM